MRWRVAHALVGFGVAFLEGFGVAFTRAGGDKSGKGRGGGSGARLLGNDEAVARASVPRRRRRSRRKRVGRRRRRILSRGGRRAEEFPMSATAVDASGGGRWVHVEIYLQLMLLKPTHITELFSGSSVAPPRKPCNSSSHPIASTSSSRDCSPTTCAPRRRCWTGRS